MENGDWQVTTDDAWNWALLRDEPMKAVYSDVERTAPFGKSDDPGVHVLVKAVPIDWPMEGGNAASVPMAPKAEGDSQVLKLVPFGDTGLRIGQFPIANEAAGSAR